MDDWKKAYTDAHVSLEAQVDAPSYEACLSWMNEIPEARAVTFDFWSRGNYTRRLIHNRNCRVQPIYVSVSKVDEMRWAYRRLALAGLTIDFIYSGTLSAPKWVRHYQPLDMLQDCGWGYIAFAGTILRSPSERRWWPVLGYARLMPERIASWVAEEASQAFLQGRINVAPSELVGIGRAVPSQHLNALAQISNGATAMETIDPAMAILDLDLPWIDGMTPADFDKLVVEHQDELCEFQSSFRELVHGYHLSLNDAELARNRVKSAVNDLMHSSRHEHLRLFVKKCKGQISTFQTAMAVIAAAGAAYSADPFAGAAVIGAAGKELRDLWKQTKEDARTESINPNRLLWRLGIEKGAVFKQKINNPGFPSPKVHKNKLGKPEACHWLCPPSDGLHFAVLNENSLTKPKTRTD